VKRQVSSQKRTCHAPALALRLWRDPSAATLLEFALAAPAFIAMMIAIFQTALLFLATQGLETAAEASGRLLLTGQAQGANYTADQFKTAACTTLPTYLNCSKLYVDVSTATSFSLANPAPPPLSYDSAGNITNSFNYAPGKSGAIVVLRLMYVWPTATGPLNFSLVNTPNSGHLLVASSVLKAEAF
jgi:Flp pilus assembly protein TadG